MTLNGVTKQAKTNSSGNKLMIMSEECEDENGGNGLASVLLLAFLQCVLAKQHFFFFFSSCGYNIKNIFLFTKKDRSLAILIEPSPCWVCFNSPMRLSSNTPSVLLKTLKKPNSNLWI